MMTLKTMKRGWLVVAAALTMAVTGCSSDNELVESIEPAVVPQAQQKVHITVGAGLGELTRSAVEETVNEGRTTRTLKFTEGDKLYVRAVIERAHDDNYDAPDDPDDVHDSKIMAGFLTIDPATISADGKIAQFTGDLDVYDATLVPVYGEEWVVDEEGHMEGDDWIEEKGHYEQYIEEYNLVYSDGTHTFETFDPLDECVYAEANLAHAASSEADYTVSDNKYFYYNNHSLASSVNELMTSSYAVGGEYDKDSQSFELGANSWNSAILNCTISGLTPGASYTVRLNYGYTEDYDDYDYYNGKVAADGEGKATFAIVAPATDYYFQLELRSSKDRKVVTLGQKELERKVYNVKATATDYGNGTDTEMDVIYGEEDWIISSSDPD